MAQSAACAQPPQELIRRHEEGVLLQDTADDDHRMGPHGVHDDIPAKLGKIERSDDRVWLARQNVVQSCLVLHQVIDTRIVRKRQCVKALTGDGLRQERERCRCGTKGR
jgi:hypothetical protein